MINTIDVFRLTDPTLVVMQITTEEENNTERLLALQSQITRLEEKFPLLGFLILHYNERIDINSRDQVIEEFIDEMMEMEYEREQDEDYE